AVVVGEAEGIWPRLLSDAASGKMQRLYRAVRMTDLKDLPKPRRDLFPATQGNGYAPIPIGVETSRGCPNDCDFCSIGRTLGHQYRVRPVQEVIAEIESIDSRHLFFVDDALGLNRNAAKKLFTEMIPLRRLWLGQGTVSLAEDLELLRLMRRSGCMGLLVGFESVQKETQNEVKKIRNLRIDFYEAMRRFHGEGFGVLGAFVFGFDYESKDVFEQTLEFVMRSRMDCVELRILTPFPGTRLYERLLSEGRLFVRDWWLRGYPPDTLLFQPKGMTADELIDGFARLNRQAYSFGAMTKRFFGMSPWKRTLLGCQVYAGINLSTRKRYFKGLRNPQPFAEVCNSMGKH
ncbi:MAG: radical SAM protein, partial [Syntrophorhabdales bacterium]